MVLKELFEALMTPSIQRGKKLPHQYDINKLAKQRDNTVGASSGWYSQGKPGEDPHEYNVSTWLPTDLTFDAKYHWVKAIYPIMGDNPHLPVYYNIKFERDKNNFIKTNYTMENLLGLSALRLEQLRALAAKTFNDEKFYDVAVTPEMIAKLIREIIIDYRFKKTPAYNVDPELEQALKLIVEVLNKNSAFSIDMHAGNIMVRNTGYGLQLVITDPIGDDGRSIRGPK
jgi:hypothetical protein